MTALSPVKIAPKRRTCRRLSVSDNEHGLPSPKRSSGFAQAGDGVRAERIAVYIRTQLVAINPLAVPRCRSA